MNLLSAIKLTRRCLLLGGVFASSAVLAQAQETPSLTALQQENQALSARLKTLEDLVQKNGLMPTGNMSAAASAPKPITALNNMTISGFVQTSFFSNLNDSQTHLIPGYLWSTTNNSFLVNKVKLTFAGPPVARSDTDWSASYRVSLLAGHDAPILNSSTGASPNGFEYIREAYAEANVPVGNGLIVRGGELISLLNWESGDGGAANPNFSQGYQWYYTGNGPAAGVQADYAVFKWFDVKLRASNGLYAGETTTGGRLGLMGSLNFTPTADSWVNVIGFGGNGAPGLNVNGASVIGGYQFTKALGTGFEADDFMFRPTAGAGGTLWSLGGWVWYDFTPKIGVAMRAEYLDDKNGVGVKSPPGPAPFGAGIGTISPTPNGILEDLTFTVNLHPVPYLKIQPEFRVNHTSYVAGFNGKEYEYIIGCGATCAF